MAGIPEVSSTSTAGYVASSATSTPQQQTQQTQQVPQVQQTQQKNQQAQQKNQQAQQPDVSAVYTSTATNASAQQNATAESIATRVQNAIRDDYKDIDTKDLDNITQELNKLMSKLNPNLQFDYHQEVGVMSVRLLNKETGEVIKELPPEDMVKNQLKRKIWLGAVIGTFIDKIA